ncbi:MAG TPA: pyruvate formate lyase-activating protein [Dysgonomonas sp.]|nr:pyruvate formate lyase-activating protein [Dysgonomonas sp.]
MEGYIHSFETFGTKDGPGIRFVLFLQGCPLRCLYCHNPDTWNKEGAKYIWTSQQVFDEMYKVRMFTKGGITVSGGEPLLQPDFVSELFRLCKENNIHTAVDTSGYLLNNKIKEVLRYTDLVLLDVKHIDTEKYYSLTARPLEPTLQFIDYLSEINKPVWLRYVLVPDYTDAEEDLIRWAEYMSRFRNIERVDILPFHQMGLHKWEQIGKDYKMKNVRTPSKEEIDRAEHIFKSYGLPV